MTTELHDEANQRRASAMSQFPAAQSLAADHGMLLVQISDSRYQLKTKEWTLNIHPGIQRVSWAKSRIPCELPIGDKSLIEIVQEVANSKVVCNEG